MTAPDLSLVVPVYNEAARLPGTLGRLVTFAHEEHLSLEIVVSDDGSTDGTGNVCQTWLETHRPAHVAVSLVRITHRGKGAAVRAGMAHVHAPIVGYCDADLSAGPDAVLQLLESIGRGADIAMASRGLPRSVLAVRQPWYRERAGRTLNAALRRLTGVPFKDTQCGLKLFRAPVARTLFAHQRLDGFAFDIELVLMAQRLGFRIDEVPIRWAHASGSKVSLVRDAVRMARDTLRVNRRLALGPILAPGVPEPRAMERMTGGEDGHWWHVAKRRLVRSYIDSSLAPRRCLDVGCGGGAMLAEAAALGSVVGMDLSLAALHHARDRRLPALLLSEAAAVPLADWSFSTVLALDVIEHHAQPEALLREFHRVLVPGGRVIVTVPAFEWMWSYADDVLGHYRRYTRRQLADELAASGFLVRRVSYVHTWLLPVAWAFRTVRTVLRQTGAADDFAVPAILNRALLAVCSLERRWFKRRDLMFGLSVVAIGEKPRADAAGAQSAALVTAPAESELATSLGSSFEPARAAGTAQGS
jgi:dolichyl-phosphate beta-glucosyltransferase